MSSHVMLGFCLAALVSVAAVRTRSITASAAIVATGLGTIVFAAGGFGWALPVLVFFVTSSLLTQHGVEADIGARKVSRTAAQVFANGSVPALWALGHIVVAGPLWTVPFASAVATAAADTWATEIGRRSRTAPRDLLTGRPVPVGTSGGVTPSGLAASLAGSVVVALACLPTGILGLRAAGIVCVAGFGGALADSLLGASIQQRTWCPACLVETEDSIHALCLTPTVHRRGIQGFDNDRVNTSAALIGSAVGLLLEALT